MANVLMAQHVARRREFAMRRALGASRGRLVRELLVESLIVALLAGIAGFAVSFGLSGLVLHFGERDTPSRDNYSASYNETVEPAFKELKQIYAAAKAEDRVRLLVSKGKLICRCSCRRFPACRHRDRYRSDRSGWPCRPSCP